MVRSSHIRALHDALASHARATYRPGTAMTLRRFLPLGLAALVAALVYWAMTGDHPPHSDWDQIYRASRVFLSGGDPYLPQAGRLETFPNYPATALLLLAPVTWLPLVWAKAVWAGLATWAFAAAVSRKGYWGLLAIGSAPFCNAVLLGQWSPLLVAAAVLPWLTVVWAAKPTIGAALFAAYPSKRSVVLGVGLLLATLALSPTWPAHWLATLGHTLHLRAPITRPGGLLLLLGLLRWRTSEGRLLAALALVPQTSSAYELLPLFLIPGTWRQMAALVLLSQLAFVVAWSLPGIDPFGDLAGTLSRQWPVWLVACYLPALAMALRPRPGLAPAPAGADLP